MHSDIKTVRAAATGAATAGRVRIVGFHVAHDAVGAGRLTITNGNGGATALDLDFDATAGTSGATLPGEGILCPAGAYVSVFTNIIGVTLYYTG